MPKCTEVEADVAKEPDVAKSEYAHLSSRRSVAAIHGIFWSAINAFVPMIASGLVFIISSRYLTPADFGLVALAGSFGALASAIGPGAFGEALVQRVHVERLHLDTVFWLCACSATVLYVTLVALSKPIAGFVGQSLIVPLIPLLGSRVIFDLGAVVPNALIARSMSFNLIALRTSIAAIISAIICIVMLTLGYGLWALAISQISISVVSCAAAFLGAGWRPGVQISSTALRDLGRYALFGSGNRFLQLMNVDQITIGSLAGPAPLGIYNFSRRIFMLLNDLIAGALSSVSHSLLSSLQNEREKVREAFLLATYGSALISFPTFVGLGAVAPDAIPLVFGPQWLQAVFPVQCFCAIGLPSCISVIQASLITSQGKNHWWFYHQLFQQLLTVLIIACLYSSGITPIVFAIAIKTIVSWPITAVMSLKILDLRPAIYLKQFVPPACASILMIAAIMALEQNIATADSRVRLLSEISLGGFVYVLAVSLLSRARLRFLISMIWSNKAKTA
jgi:O-antigen/teichoic acid export membrane protein